MIENEPAERLRQQLAVSVRSIAKERHKLKLFYTTLFTVALSSGVIATIISALAALSGGKLMLASGARGWQLTCGVIAIFTLISTITSSFQQNIWVKDRYWKIEDSYGILKSLLKEIEFDPDQLAAVRRDYQRLIQRHPDVLG